VTIRRLALCICLLGAVYGCSPAPSQPQSVAAFKARQLQAAEQAQQRGELAAALALLRSVATAAPQDAAITAQIASLESIIATQTDNAIRQGKAAYARGNYRRGDHWMRKALALRPGEPRALEALRDSVSTQMRASLSRKVESPEGVTPYAQTETDSAQEQLRRLYEAGDYHALLERSAALPDSPDPESARLVRLAHLALAEQAATKNDPTGELAQLKAARAVYPLTPDPLPQRIASLRKDLADQWYRRGTSLMQTDLDQAISALQQSVDYDPQNSRAKMKLKQAQTLQRNLQKIQNNTAR
tara:strand:- start:3448 stop:4350 length:903 start_codon:yes stop_codon:yes gene_type:complete